jgi:hypothetical protein
MYKISDRDLVTAEQRLLHNIWQTLQNIESKLCAPDKSDNNKENKLMQKYICPTCGIEHKNMGSKLACIKKHKKEGAKK